MKKLTTIILAAGKGTRMNSTLSKVLHPITNQSMLSHVVDKSKKLNSDNQSNNQSEFDFSIDKLLLLQKF